MGSVLSNRGKFVPQESQTRDTLKKAADVCREAIKLSFRDGGYTAIEQTMLDNVDQCEKDGNVPGLEKICNDIQLRISLDQRM